MRSILILILVCAVVRYGIVTPSPNPPSTQSSVPRSDGAVQADGGDGGGDGRPRVEAVRRVCQSLHHRYMQYLPLLFSLYCWPSLEFRSLL